MQIFLFVPEKKVFLPRKISFSEIVIEGNLTTKWLYNDFY